MINVLIADPDITCREMIAKSLSTISELKIICTCPNGKSCIDKIKKHCPEVVIAAVELGDMDIVKFLSEAKAVSPQTGIIVVTQPDNHSHADLAVTALGSGAFDYLVKPSAQCSFEQVPLINRLLAPKIWCFTIKRFSEMAKTNAAGPAVPHDEYQAKNLPAIKQARLPAIATSGINDTYRVVLIGVSTGGPEALTKMLPLFPVNFPLPIVIVLHMPKLFTGPMANNLDVKSAISVHEAQDNDLLLPGHAYLAPGGIHLTINDDGHGNLIARTLDGNPENGCKPSVDVLFRSASKIVKEKAIAVILTGMGVDGTNGAKALKAFNVPIIAQDEATSVVWGMPGNIVKSGLTSAVLPLLKIPEKITSMLFATHD